MGALSEIVRDLVRQMLRLRFDDTTILFHLRSANIRNGKQILESVLDEAKQEAISKLDPKEPSPFLRRRRLTNLSRDL